MLKERLKELRPRLMENGTENVHVVFHETTAITNVHEILEPALKLDTIEWLAEVIAAEQRGQVCLESMVLCGARTEYYIAQKLLEPCNLPGMDDPTAFAGHGTPTSIFSTTTATMRTNLYIQLSLIDTELGHDRSALRHAQEDWLHASVLNSTLSMDNKMDMVHINMACSDISAKLGRLDDAIKHLKEILILEPDSPILLEKLSELEKRLRIGGNVDPINVQTFITMSSRFVSSGYPDRAIVRVKAGLENFPDNPILLQRLHECEELVALQG